MPRFFRVTAAAGRGSGSGESPLEGEGSLKPACLSQWGTGLITTITPLTLLLLNHSRRPVVDAGRCLKGEDKVVCLWKGLIVEKVMLRSTKGCENVAPNAVCRAYTSFLINYSAFFFLSMRHTKKQKHAQLVHNKVVDHCAVSFSSNESENCEVGSPICCGNLSKDLQLCALGDASQEPTWRRRLFSGTVPPTHIYVG